MDDLQRFKETYISECFELLEDMEEKLVGLDGDSANLDDLNAIFRCAHSIKGGAGAFGLTQIAKFTHILEALLDKVREGQIAVSPEVVSALLQARDVVYKMVVAAQNNTSTPEGFGDDVKTELERLCGMQPSAGGSAKIGVDLKGSQIASSGIKHFNVKFKPHSNMLLTGSEPLLMLRELKKVGECEVSVDMSSLPALDKIDAETCYLSWQVIVKTDKGIDALKEVFEFVEDECDLEIQELENSQESKQQEVSRLEAEAVAEAKPQAAKAQSQAGGGLTGQSANAQAQSGAAAAATSIRVDIDKVDRLINMVGEIVIVQAMLRMQTASLPSNQYAGIMTGVEELSQHTRELQEAVMAIRMQPVKSIFSRMPRLVRDLSGQLGKNIKLEIDGESTEVDKTIIEQLSDPLTHMIRNSVDHGVEKPDVRAAAGKPEQGTIFLAAMHRGGRVVIEVSDDGNGINREKVLKKAIEKGVVAENANLSDNEIDQLIFAPGFSTADSVTDVSGRGVGMDVVRRNIESIGGVVLVTNTPGQGSKFTISLPLTLAILDGMIVRVANEHYIIPIGNIVETMRPKPNEVKGIADGSSVISVRGDFIPVHYLYKFFNIKNAVADASQALVVLVEAGNKQIGLVVDELVGQQQVVIKSLEENSDPIKGISGATILGDGKVSLILDVAGLAEIATNKNMGGQILEAA